MKITIDKIFIILLLINPLLIAQGDMFSSGSNRPRANAGPDIQIIPNQSISLDASRSFIRDGSKLKYEWILSPGLALKSDNEFDSEISVDFYKNKYLKSVQTYKKVIEVNPYENKSGTKLEVVLSVKDRIGFEDLDTLFIEYIKPLNVEVLSEDPPLKESKIIISEVEIETIDSLETNEIILMPEQALIDSSAMTSGVLVEGLKDSQLEISDMKIINSIMANQIKITGYNKNIFYNNNIKSDSLEVYYNLNCTSDSCIAENGLNLKVDFILLWSITESNEKIFIRLFDPKNPNIIIESYSILNPLVSISESGIYSLDSEIRKAINSIFYNRLFYKNLSRSKKLERWNKRIIRMGKYPFALGVAYLLVDKIFFDNRVEDPPIIPPGFPHDS